MIGSGLPFAHAEEPKAQKREFTVEEAKFLAYLASQDGQFDFMKALLKLADQDLPTSATDLAEILVKKVVQVRMGSPGVEKALKDLDETKCLASSNEIELYLKGSHPQAKGKPSDKNKQFFTDLKDCYKKKK